MLDDIGIGADVQVTVHRGRYQNPLTAACRGLEDHMTDGLAHALFKQDVLTLARGDGEAIITHHACDVIGIQTGCVDNHRRSQRLTACSDGESVLGLLNVGDLGFAQILCARSAGNLKRCRRQFIRANDARRRCVQGADRIRLYVRFQFVKFVCVDDAQTGYTVLYARLIKLFYCLSFLITESQYQRTNTLKGYIQLAAYILHIRVAAHIQTCLVAARLGIITCVDDAAVCTAGLCRRL